MAASNDDLEAMKQNDAHSMKQQGKQDAVPGSDAEHAHSHAAHLGHVDAHTKPAGDMRQIEQKEESVRESGRATETYRGA